MVDIFGYFFWATVFTLYSARYLFVPAAFVGGIYLGLKL